MGAPGEEGEGGGERRLSLSLIVAAKTDARSSNLFGSESERPRGLAPDRVFVETVRLYVPRYVFPPSGSSTFPVVRDTCGRSFIHSFLPSCKKATTYLPRTRDTRRDLAYAALVYSYESIDTNRSYELRESCRVTSIIFIVPSYPRYNSLIHRPCTKFTSLCNK